MSFTSILDGLLGRDGAGTNPGDHAVGDGDGGAGGAAAVVAGDGDGRGGGATDDHCLFDPRMGHWSCFRGLGHSHRPIAATA